MEELEKRVSGVLCDGRISAKVYKTAVIPTLMYRPETEPVKRG